MTFDGDRFEVNHSYKMSPRIRNRLIRLMRDKSVKRFDSTRVRRALRENNRPVDTTDAFVFQKDRSESPQGRCKVSSLLHFAML